MPGLVLCSCLLLLLPLAGASRLRRREGEGDSQESAQDPDDFQTIQKLENTIMGMVHNRNSPGVQEALNSMKPLITSMKDRISTQHQSAQELVGNYLHGFDACQLLNGTVGDLESKRAAHLACRMQEKETHTEQKNCEGVQANTQMAATMSCQTVETLESQPNFGAAMCEALPSETYESYLRRIEAYFKTKREEFEQAKTSCAAATASADNMTRQCRSIAENRTAKKMACDMLQSDLERSTCSTGAMASSACATYTTCYNRTMQRFSLDIKFLEDQASSRQVQFKSLARLECIVGVLADPTVDTSHLKMCTEQNFKADHLVLVIPQPPTKVSCSSEVRMPCSAKWIEANYGDLPAEAPAKECTPCPDVKLPKETTEESKLPNETAESKESSKTGSTAKLHILLPTASPDVPMKIMMGHFTFKNSEIMGGAENRFDFARPFTEPPVVVLLALANGGDPAVARVYDVERTGFKAWLTEPAGGDGPSREQQVAFLAALPGVHQLPDGRHLEVGSVSTKSEVASRDCKLASAVDTWANLSFKHAFQKAPALVAGIQTMANEVNAVPEAPSVPFLAVATKELSRTGAKISLERAGSARVGQVNKLERIGFVAMEQGTSAFSGLMGTDVTCVALVSNGTVGTAPTNVAFGATLPSSSPLVVGGLASRAGADGGWLRLKAAGASWAEVFVDEDQTCSSGASGSKETASIIACSTPFMT